MPYQIRDFIICFIAYWVFVVLLTIYDKKASKIQHRHRSNKTKLPRIPEVVLLIFAGAFGAIPMYITMLITHHKTQKNLFKIGMPIIIVLQVALVVILSTKIRIRVY